jgi:hypothetical protein
LVIAINDGSPDASSGTLVIPKSAPCVGESFPIGRAAAYVGGFRGGSGRRMMLPYGEEDDVAAPAGRGAPMGLARAAARPTTTHTRRGRRAERRAHARSDMVVRSFWDYDEPQLFGPDRGTSLEQFEAARPNSFQALSKSGGEGRAGAAFVFVPADPALEVIVTRRFCVDAILTEGRGGPWPVSQSRPCVVASSHTSANGASACHRSSPGMSVP